MVDKRRSVCMFCSLGCGFAMRMQGDRVIAIDYDGEDPLNKGALCPRGHYNLELINHPDRLTEPFIFGKKCSWYDAISAIRKELENSSPEEIGILLSSNSTNEDAYVAAKMAASLGINNICASGSHSDLEAYEGTRLEAKGESTADVEKIGEVDSLLIIGDILTRSPVLSKMINQVKYGKRGNQIIVIDPEKTHTSWFSTIHLKNHPGTEAVLMTGLLKVISEENKREAVDVDLKKISEVCGVPEEDIIKAAKAFDSADSGTIIFVPGKNKERNDLIQYLVKKTSARSVKKDHVTFYEYGNTYGVNLVLDSLVEGRPNCAEMHEKISSGKIKVLLNFGADVSMHNKDLRFTLECRFFPTLGNSKKTIILPLVSQMERKGTVTYSGNRNVNIRPLAHKTGGRSALQIMALLAGLKTGFDEILEETASIVVKGQRHIKTELNSVVKDVLNIKPKKTLVREDITHFGDNGLVGNFFWFKVNNG